MCGKCFGEWRSFARKKPVQKSKPEGRVFFFSFYRVYVFLFKRKYFSLTPCLRTNKVVTPRGYAGFLI